MARWRVNPWPLLTALLLIPVLAGCIAVDPDPDAQTTQDPPLPPPGSGINEESLSDETYSIAPREIQYAEMEDGVRIYVEVYLPGADGSWPTILEISPYNHGRATNAEFGVAAPETDLVERYVPRGYAVALAHLRGTGNSEGCIDMMGPVEQQDAHDIVEWAAEQEWSDGKIGMHGVSYVGTTPHMAAIMAPEHLETVVTVAGVTNQWRNVYMNGVPYMGRHYPLTYEALVGAPPPTHVSAGPDWPVAVASGTCVNQEAVAAMSPGTYEKGLYTDYWHERNLTRFADQVQASILYSQGFIDRAVNPMEAIGWFDAITAPKKAFFHQAGHTYPTRDDYRTIELAWFDHWLKGHETGVMDSATVEIQTKRDTIRVADTWPPQEPVLERFYLGAGALVSVPPDEGSERYLADLVRSLGSSGGPVAPAYPENSLSYVSDPLDEELYMAGNPRFHLLLSSDAENTYFLSDLYLVRDGEWTRLTEGWMNAHLREGFDRSTPLVPGEPAALDFLFEPREWVFEEGDQIGLMIVGNDARVGPIDLVDAAVTTNTIHYGPEGSWIELPIVDDPQEHDRPEEI